MFTESFVNSYYLHYEISKQNTMFIEMHLPTEEKNQANYTKQCQTIGIKQVKVGIERDSLTFRIRIMLP